MGKDSEGYDTSSRGAARLAWERTGERRGRDLGKADTDELTYLEALGRRVRALREIHDLGQAELGKACGLGRTSIANLEAGRQEPPVTKLRALAQHLGVTVGALLGEAPMPALPRVRVVISADVICDEHGPVKAGMDDHAEAYRLRAQHVREHLGEVDIRG